MTLPSDGADELTAVNDLVTVAEAALLLGMDESGLRRVLKRPRNAERIAGHKTERTQDTRSGLRTATVYPLALIAEVAKRPLPEPLSDIAPSLSTNGAQTTPDTTQDTTQETIRDTIPDTNPDSSQDTPTDEREPDAGHDTGKYAGHQAGQETGAVFQVDERTRAYLALLTQQMQGRIDDLTANVADLRGERDRLLLENQRLKAVTAAPGDDQNRPQERAGDTDASAGTNSGEVAGDAAQPVKRWWKFWGD